MATESFTKQFWITTEEQLDQLIDLIEEKPKSVKIIRTTRVDIERGKEKLIKILKKGKDNV